MSVAKFFDFQAEYVPDAPVTLQMATISECRYRLLRLRDLNLLGGQLKRTLVAYERRFLETLKMPHSELSYAARRKKAGSPR